MFDNKERMSQAIAFIENNLYDEQLDLRYIAEQAGLSPYHFHRTFQTIAGEPVVQYIKKRRLDGAAAMLTGSDKRIIDIAVDCGFSSQEAFTRAFSRTYGLSPGMFRRLKPPRISYRRIDPLNDRVSGYPPISPQFKTIEKSRVFGISKSVRMYGHAGARKIMSLWKDFCRYWPDDLPYTDEFYGLGIYDIDKMIPEGDSFEYFACAPLPWNMPVPTGCSEREIPEGLYAVFEYNGPKHRIRDVFDFIFGSWFPDSPFQLRSDLTNSIGFELYTKNHYKKAINRSISVYVPVTPG